MWWHSCSAKNVKELHTFIHLMSCHVMYLLFLKCLQIIAVLMISALHSPCVISEKPVCSVTSIETKLISPANVIHWLLFKPAWGETLPTQCFILYMLGAIVMACYIKDKDLPLIMCSFYQMCGNLINSAQVGYCGWYLCNSELSIYYFGDIWFSLRGGLDLVPSGVMSLAGH